MYTFFEQYENLTASMSEASDGNMRIRSNDFESDILKNRKAFCQKNNIQYSTLISALTEHTANVGIVEESKEQFIENVDALVTKHKNIYLSVTSADCLPVVFYDVKNEIVGIAHAGWRGIAKEIITHTIDAMQKIGADTQNIHMAIGPGISQENFEFGREKMLNFFGQYDDSRYVAEGSTPDKIKIDLSKIVFDQAVDYGIKKNSINTCDLCTFEKNRFFSARRYQKEPFAVMMAMIGMKSS